MEGLGDKVEEMPQEVKHKDEDISMKEKVLVVPYLTNRSSKKTEQRK